MARLRVGMVEDSERIRARLAETLAKSRTSRSPLPPTPKARPCGSSPRSRGTCVILDLQLRVGTGLGVLKALQGLLAREPHIAIVFTNYAFRQYRERALALGARHFFDKSRDVDAMRKVLTDLAAQAATA